RNVRKESLFCYYLLNLTLQRQKPSLKRLLQRREKRDPKTKGEKLTVVRKGITLKKMEMPSQTTQRKTKVLGIPNSVFNSVSYILRSGILDCMVIAFPILEQIPC
uniref:Uncharacterized protein n=1 Tax=Bos indicus x Bos taurus TaxID=30522 RepID=A0A4W2BZE9_BOBOX